MVAHRSRPLRRADLTIIPEPIGRARRSPVVVGGVVNPQAWSDAVLASLFVAACISSKAAGPGRKGAIASGQRRGLSGMWQAIGELLPSALGVALSPVPIIAVILMLGTPKARSNGPAFAVGWVLGLVVVSVVVVLLASGADDPDSGSSTAVDWVKVVIGALFLLMAAGQWRKRPKPGTEPELPKWMSAVNGFTAGKSLGLGALLSGANPKNLALTLAASATIAQAGLSGGETTVAIAVFVILGSVTVAGPVLFYVFASTKAAGPLESIKQFMADHNAVIMMVVLLVLGVKVLGQGIGGLAD